MGDSKPKVYCGQCRWYRWQGSWSPVGGKIVIPASDACKHPTNKQEVDSYRGRSIQKNWTPECWNAKNDCQLFEVKPKRQGVAVRVFGWIFMRRTGGLPDITSIPPMPKCKPPKADSVAGNSPTGTVIDEHEDQGPPSTMQSEGDGENVYVNGISVAALYAQHRALGTLINHAKNSGAKGAIALDEWDRARARRYHHLQMVSEI